MVSDFLSFSKKMLFSVIYHNAPRLVASGVPMEHGKIAAEYPFGNRDVNKRRKNFLKNIRIQNGTEPIPPISLFPGRSMIPLANTPICGLTS